MLSCRLTHAGFTILATTSRAEGLDPDTRVHIYPRDRRKKRTENRGRAIPLYNLPQRGDTNKRSAGSTTFKGSLMSVIADNFGHAV